MAYGLDECRLELSRGARRELCALVFAIRKPFRVAKKGVNAPNRVRENRASREAAFVGPKVMYREGSCAVWLSRIALV
jgi:hypothetical protein